MSSSSNISQSGYSPSEPETPQNTPQTRLQNFEQSLSRGDIGHSFEHQKRIQALRKELDYLKSTEWKFDFDKGFIHSDDDDAKEDYLAQELVELEIQLQQEEYLNSPTKQLTRNNENCITKTGVITFCGDNYILIDGMIYFDTTDCSIQLNVNDKVLYLGYRDSNDSTVIVRILENQGLFWGGDEEFEEKSFETVEHVIVGHVSGRQDRFVYISESDLKFSLDDVQGTFVPIEGDWLEMKCTVQQNSDNLSDISANKVLKVITFSPLRKKFVRACVTQCFGNSGICDRSIYFDETSITNGVKPVINSQVAVEAIESNQGSCSWRAIKLQIMNQVAIENKISEVTCEEIKSIATEKDKCISMTHPLKFENVKLNEIDRTITLTITNNNNNSYTFNKWIVLSRKHNSQINIEPFINHPIKLHPGKTINFTVTCKPKFYGQARESLVLLFKGFQLIRFVNIDVVNNEYVEINSCNNLYSNNRHDKLKAMKKLRDNNCTKIPGVRMKKAPAFVNVRIGNFPIPDKIWSIILANAEKTTNRMDMETTVSLLETSFPFLAQELCIRNYIDKWHTILYLEEIEMNLHMRNYDNDRVFLVHCNEYLSIEIAGLAERKPSLMMGDKAVVKDVWSPDGNQYEGFIHAIKGNLVLIKFCRSFHETYRGGDVSIVFHSCRTNFKRAHHAINIALSNLGPDLLFPSRVNVKQAQANIDNIDDIKWFNSKLNTEQKNAVLNIIKGKCRPMPYIIFGPPGTGKTITVIETILQILTLIPESRILIATPSNSASNLLTERLIQYKHSFTGSIVRLIAHYLIDSDSISNDIKPYCATIDVSVERSTERKYELRDGMHLNCQKSLIGRHRVTIGTCYCLGALKHLDLPKGHFTHVIVDEAGQASEPEIMIPLTFTDKNHGQIILAGDPMQLGPVIQSKYSREYGMDESFLCRLLDCFNYKKDYHSFLNGFDNRLVTKLNVNYRSLKEIIELPSEMFYDGTLVATVNKTMMWTLKYLNAISEIFELQSTNGGTFIYGIKGCNLRGEDSPSWYNPQEASMIALTLCKLYKKNLTPDEIGIITPYIAQVKFLRTLCDSMGLPEPKIGTVEDFQGQERPIILISTVRSNQSLIDEDIRFALGFVGNAKRLNVALTRAQISTVIFCNPHLLSKDFSWKKVIANVVSSGKYMGCDLPQEFSNLHNND